MSFMEGGGFGNNGTRRPENGDRRTEHGDRSPVAAPIESGEPKPGRWKTENEDRRPETGDRRPETGDGNTAPGGCPDSIGGAEARETRDILK
jgi:hypothetical protein